MPIKSHRATIDGMIYPIYYRGRGGIDDQPWILKMMRFIPKNKQLEVSLKYEKLYRSKYGGDRKAAQTYLHKEAKFYSEKNK